MKLAKDDKNCCVSSFAILCRAGSRAEVEALVAEDPFARTGAARHEIIEFHPSLWTPGMKELLAQKVL